MRETPNDGGDGGSFLVEAISLAGLFSSAVGIVGLGSGLVLGSLAIVKQTLSETGVDPDRIDTVNTISTVGYVFLTAGLLTLGATSWPGLFNFGLFLGFLGLVGKVLTDAYNWL